MNNKISEKETALKELLNLSSTELFDKSEFNFSDAGLKYKVHNRLTVNLSMDKLIENSFAVFTKFYDDVSIDEFIELKKELVKLPFHKYPIVYFFEEQYIDYGVYHILHFIKDTKYILTHYEDKKRYFHSTYKTKVLEAQIKLMEKIKTEKFLYPTTKFDKEVLEKKDKLLSFVNEHYNMIFAWNSFGATLNTTGISKDQVADKVIEDFKDSLNAIRTTQKDAIKSLAIILFKMYDTQMDGTDLELTIENILRIFFKNEIEKINEKKDLNPEYLDTFKVSSKEYKKDSYIFSVFDNIPIYGINDQNKYFYFYKMTVREVMKMYFFFMKEASPFTGNIQITKTYYKFIRQLLQNPHQTLYKRQYQEFFNKKNPTALDLMATFFQEMKKNAPDNLR